MSNETQWTPGPWEVIDDGYTHKIMACGTELAGCNSAGDVSDTTNGANARLIAAAPEMAELLERMTKAAERRLRELRALNSIDALQLTNDIADARALLAKIKGATNA